MSYFAARLKELREAAGLTQKELAALAGLHPHTVAKLEQDIQVPTWDTVQTIARALKVNCTAFEKKPAKIRKPRMGRPPSKS